MKSRTQPEQLPDELELLIADINGIPRGKTMAGDSYSATHLPHLAEAVCFQGITGEYSPNKEIYIPTDRDLLLRPDWSTYQPTAWKAGNISQVLCDALDYQHKPIAYDSRQVLKRVLRAYRRIGLQPIIAPELEFYLLEPVGKDNETLIPAAGLQNSAEFGCEAFSPDALEKYQPILTEISSAAASMDISVSAIGHEMGPAQIELNLDHGPALQRTDQLFQLKRLVKGCAQNAGINASFMGKPIAGLPGNGLHLHVSLLDNEGTNLFRLGRRGSAPPALRHFMGGLQTYLPGVFALLAPHVNSYKRFVRDLAAPINLEWGYDNRTTGLRVPFSARDAGRVESRVAGADANPYLLVAATLACGLLGLRHSINPGRATAADAYNLPATLPSDLPTALSLLSACHPMHRLLGPAFVDVFLSVKQQELSSYNQVITAWEVAYLGSQL